MKEWTFISGAFFYSNSEELSRSKSYDGEVVRTSPPMDGNPGIYRSRMVPSDRWGNPT